MNKRLYRSRREKMIGGVAGGLAEYFEIDPVIVRLAFVLLFFAGGITFLAYIVCLIVIPKEPWSVQAPSPDTAPHSEAPEQDQQIFEPVQKASQKKTTIGVIMVMLGLVLLAHNFLPFFCHVDYFPVILILIGAWLILGHHQKGIEQ